jgi:Recombination endonuclease VII
MDRKFCRDCGEYRPVSAFSANRRSRDGLAFYCRDHLAERSARTRAARREQPVRYRSRPRDLRVPDGHKWCPDCRAVKPKEEFPRSRASASGVGSYCLPCHNERGRKNLEKRGGSRTYHLTRRYGITAAEADFLLEGQGGLCAICRVAPAEHVDHIHDTGEVRALLCFNCNGGLGQFRDDPAVLRAAADYVEEHRRRQAGGGARPLAARRREAVSRPVGTPVGSGRRPGTRSGGLAERGRRNTAAREADG